VSVIFRANLKVTRKKKGGEMTVKILIKRKVPDTQLEALTLLLRQFRVLAIEQPGYVSGETLQRIDQPGESLVISTWQSASDWDTWVDNPTRKSIQAQIDALLGTKTTWEVYGAG
jgi:quinol monooxygenase YgiN